MIFSFLFFFERPPCPAPTRRGSGWRDAFGGVVNEDVYYVLKDVDGNYYKFDFTDFTSTEGERGHYQFTYERL